MKRQSGRREMEEAPSTLRTKIFLPAWNVANTPAHGLQEGVLGRGLEAILLKAASAFSAAKTRASDSHGVASRRRSFGRMLPTRLTPVTSRSKALSPRRLAIARARARATPGSCHATEITAAATS
jgi:hypothetical protein